MSLFVLSFISPLQVAQHVSGNHVPIFRGWRLRSVIATCWCCSVAAGRLSRSPQWTHYLLTGSDSLPAATEQHQHVAITPRSRQPLKMGTWLPETRWATSRREIKYTKVTFSWFFLSTLNYDARSSTHQIVKVHIVHLNDPIHFWGGPWKWCM